ncbi:armadillo-type protein [Apodospora peruviana]|uniref:Armadillo-type protein n=1 Tax=Apodospora peruviana TaxID=516989 RepID=A0AAE0HY80_9PEZI|nr:armadillo-type protein [Apodospora peruviana]
MSAAASTGSPNERRASASKSFSQDENAKQPSVYDDFRTSSSQKLKINHESPSSADMYPMDKLYAKLAEQQVMMPQHHTESYKDEEAVHVRGFDLQSSCSSLPITPATENFGTEPTARCASATPNEGHASTEEVLRLKLELAQAQTKISRLDQELAQTRLMSQDSGCVTPSEMEFPASLTVAPSPAVVRAPAGPTFTGPTKVPFSREQTWVTQDDTRSDTGDATSTAGLGRARGIWSTKAGFTNTFPQGLVQTDGLQPMPWAQHRTGYEPPFVAPAMDNYRSDRGPVDHEMGRPAQRRGNRFDNRFYGGYNIGPYEPAPTYSAPLSSTLGGGLGVSLYSPYQQQPVGTPLSPHATEFTTGGAAPWKTEIIAPEGQTYLPATEPLNYRRLLDRNVTCDWKYIVDKIVCNNDQQASIFLQQKLKVGTPEQKYDIVEAIVAQAYPLMVNRFGNFLVQRCFEHGTPEQVIKIAEGIRGNTLNLSMDPFGCHVVQKAFDSVPEDYKAIMVHELLRRIPETVIHRYACHVWQKLFELRWTESPPQIMKYVNEALRGMWHEVALGETGSLVVQNIFENCLEEDKRPCIEEVLANIDIVAHGQFGNWCIQHICEHGAPADRSRAVDHVIRYAAEYSMDQFASKVVEKCLKISGPDFLGRYLDRVCEGRHDRTRIPLIDIASDQYGNYLIQYILTHAQPQHREVVAAHIRKHMVSLRGSKFGSRVGMLCTNHAVATRPGPSVGPTMGSRMAPGPRYGSTYR